MTPNAPPNKHLDYLLTAYLFENLSAAGKKEVETHLAQCPACRDELDALRATMGLLATALNDGGKTYVFEEQRKKRVLDAARNGQLGFVARKVGGWQWKLSAVAAIVMVGVVCLSFAAFFTNSSRSAMVAGRSGDMQPIHYGERGETSERLRAALNSRMKEEQNAPTPAPAAADEAGVTVRRTTRVDVDKMEAPNISASSTSPRVYDGQITLGVQPIQTGPQSPVPKGVEIPADLLKKAELSDHFERLDRPELNNAFEAPDLFFHDRKGVINDKEIAAGGGGNGGKALDDMIGATATKTPGAKSPGSVGGITNGVDGEAGRGTFGNRSGGGRRLDVKRHGGLKEEAAKEPEGFAANELAPKPDNKPASPAAPAHKDVALAAKDDTIRRQDGESKSPGQGQSVEELNKQLAHQNAQVTEQLSRTLDEKVSKLDDETALPEKAQEGRTATITGKNSKAPASGYKLPPPGETSALDQDYLFDDVAKRDPMKKPALTTLPEPVVALRYIIRPAAETPPPPPSSIPRPPVVAFSLDSNAPQQPAKPVIVATTPVGGTTPLNSSAYATIQGGQPSDPAAPSEPKSGLINGDGKGTATVDPLGQSTQFGAYLNGSGPGLTPPSDPATRYSYDRASDSPSTQQGVSQNRLPSDKKEFQSLNEKKGGITSLNEDETEVTIKRIVESEGLVDQKKAKKSDDGRINAQSLGIIAKPGDKDFLETIGTSMSGLNVAPAKKSVEAQGKTTETDTVELFFNQEIAQKRGAATATGVKDAFLNSVPRGLDANAAQANGQEQAKTPAVEFVPPVFETRTRQVGESPLSGADEKVPATLKDVEYQVQVKPADWNSKSLDAAELSLRGYRALRDENPKLTLAQFFRRPDVVHPVPLTDEGLDEDDYVTKYGTRPFVDCARDHLSTFGLDVDTAAYTLARAALRSEKLPDPGSVKVEEFLNYFKQAYQVQGDEAFGVFAESAQSPFIDSPIQSRDAAQLASALIVNNQHSRELLKIGIKSRAARPGERKPAMLTFVVDTSGSMSKPAGVNHVMSRLALVKQALTTLVESLQPEDAVSIVGFRDQSELVLPRTQASQKQRILDAIDSMSARGSTNVETGLNLGYRMADEAYATNAVNRMILFSDGVANVGEKGPDEILKLVKIFASRGIDLSTIGVGMGKINDPMMRTLADNGNGSCHFADTLAEAQTILTQKLPPHLNVLARDAKVQVDFDSDTVKSYRLLGYEKRKIADKDFRNDKIDSGDVTHDTLVTVFYEIVRQSGVHGALGKVYLRWKDAGSPRLEVVERNYPLEQGIYAGPAAKASPDFRFLACVARFAELLRDSKWTRQGSYAEVLAELDRLPNEFKAKPECQEVRDLVARAQRLSVTKWKCEILK